LGITGRVMLTIALAGSDDQRDRWVEAIDMRAPGVTVDPLRGMTGHAHLNEVFFDGVSMLDSDVVADVNRRRLVASSTLE
jgi:alkylation response protein AidB-like acyl-CoA dehydrogenase